MNTLFKKRPNFLNSTPTITESALLLLSAPSVRFWQQTAICPVSAMSISHRATSAELSTCTSRSLDYEFFTDATRLKFLNKNLMAISYADADFISNFSDS
jgi:hypothetical protein